MSNKEFDLQKDLQDFQNFLDVTKFLEKNNIGKSQTVNGDIFIHCFKQPPQNISLEDFAKKLFKEGVRKLDLRSILSTIELLPKEKYIEKIKDVSPRGNYKIILKIPEEVDGIFLGRCKQIYGDSGNQYTQNSFLDFISHNGHGLEFIPPEFIVGIAYKDTNSQYQFIQNPKYFDNSVENSKKLADKLEDMIKQSDNPILEYIAYGGTQPDTSLMKKQGIYDSVKGFLDQRADYDYKKDNELII